MPHPLYITTAGTSHIGPILRFEQENRDWFLGYLPSKVVHRIDEGYLTRQLANREKENHCLILDAQEELIGRFILTYLNEQKTQAELTYRLARKWSGQGIATYSLRRLLPVWACQGVEEITAQVSLNNPASSRVLSKSGFHLMEYHSQGMRIGTDEFAMMHYVWRANE